MCPFCAAATALVIAKVTFAGRAGALTAKKLLPRTSNDQTEPAKKEKHHDHQRQR